MNKAVYTHGHHESVLRSHRWRTVENSAAYLMPHLRAGIRLLDVGCGPATLREMLPPTIEYFGVDIAADVIEGFHDSAVAIDRWPSPP